MNKDGDLSNGNDNSAIYASQDNRNRLANQKLNVSYCNCNSDLNLSEDGGNGSSRSVLLGEVGYNML